MCRPGIGYSGNAKDNTNEDSWSGCGVNISHQTRRWRRVPTNEKLKNGVSFEPYMSRDECSQISGQQGTSRQEEQEPNSAEDSMSNNHLLVGLKRNVNNTGWTWGRIWARPIWRYRVRKTEPNCTKVSMLNQSGRDRRGVRVYCPNSINKRLSSITVGLEKGRAIKDSGGMIVSYWPESWRPKKVSKTIATVIIAPWEQKTMKQKVVIPHSVRKKMKQFLVDSNRPLAWLPKMLCAGRG